MLRKSALQSYSSSGLGRRRTEAGRGAVARAARSTRGLHSVAKQPCSLRDGQTAAAGLPGAKSMEQLYSSVLGSCPSGVPPKAAPTDLGSAEKINYDQKLIDISVCCHGKQMIDRDCLRERSALGRNLAAPRSRATLHAHAFAVCCRR
jgi:hypothetical protein